MVFITNNDGQLERLQNGQYVTSLTNIDFDSLGLARLVTDLSPSFATEAQRASLQTTIEANATSIATLVTNIGLVTDRVGVLESGATGTPVTVSSDILIAFSTNPSSVQGTPNGGSHTFGRLVTPPTSPITGVVFSATRPTTTATTDVYITIGSAVGTTIRWSLPFQIDTQSGPQSLSTLMTQIGQINSDISSINTSLAASVEEVSLSISGQVVSLNIRENDGVRTVSSVTIPAGTGTGGPAVAVTQHIATVFVGITADIDPSTITLTGGSISNVVTLPSEAPSNSNVVVLAQQPSLEDANYFAVYSSTGITIGTRTVWSHLTEVSSRERIADYTQTQSRSPDFIENAPRLSKYFFTRQTETPSQPGNPLAANLLSSPSFSSNDVTWNETVPSGTDTLWTIIVIQNRGAPDSNGVIELNHNASVPMSFSITESTFLDTLNGLSSNYVSARSLSNFYQTQVSPDLLTSSDKRVLRNVSAVNIASDPTLQRALLLQLTPIFNYNYDTDFRESGGVLPVVRSADHVLLNTEAELSVVPNEFRRFFTNRDVGYGSQRINPYFPSQTTSFFINTAVSLTHVPATRGHEKTIIESNFKLTTPEIQRDLDESILRYTARSILRFSHADGYYVPVSTGGANRLVTEQVRSYLAPIDSLLHNTTEKSLEVEYAFNISDADALALGSTNAAIVHNIVLFVQDIPSVAVTLNSSIANLAVDQALSNEEITFNYTASNGNAVSIVKQLTNLAYRASDRRFSFSFDLPDNTQSLKIGSFYVDTVTVSVPTGGSITRVPVNARNIIDSAGAIDLNQAANNLVESLVLLEPQIEGSTVTDPLMKIVTILNGHRVSTNLNVTESQIFGTGGQTILTLSETSGSFNGLQLRTVLSESSQNTLRLTEDDLTLLFSRRHQPWLGVFSYLAFHLQRLVIATNELFLGEAEVATDIEDWAKIGDDSRLPPSKLPSTDQLSQRVVSAGSRLNLRVYHSNNNSLTSSDALNRRQFMLFPSDVRSIVLRYSFRGTTRHTTSLNRFHGPETAEETGSLPTGSHPSLNSNTPLLFNVAYQELRASFYIYRLLLTSAHLANLGIGQGDLTENQLSLNDEVVLLTTVPFRAAFLLPLTSQTKVGFSTLLSSSYTAPVNIGTLIGETGADGQSITGPRGLQGESIRGEQGLPGESIRGEQGLPGAIRDLQPDELADAFVRINTQGQYPIPFLGTSFVDTGIPESVWSQSDYSAIAVGLQAESVYEQVPTVLVVSRLRSLTRVAPNTSHTPSRRHVAIHSPLYRGVSLGNANAGTFSFAFAVSSTNGNLLISSVEGVLFGLNKSLDVYYWGARQGVGVPTGGELGQILTKTSSTTDFDTEWADASGGGGGGGLNRRLLGTTVGNFSTPNSYQSSNQIIFDTSVTGFTHIEVEGLGIADPAAPTNSSRRFAGSSQIISLTTLRLVGSTGVNVGSTVDAIGSCFGGLIPQTLSPTQLFSTSWESLSIAQVLTGTDLVGIAVAISDQRNTVMNLNVWALSM